ncbi:MAG: exo-alpha-sialidase [Anaerolineae bacterium]|nr:exo-alpha-sialidase [Anaerolineae bacterium]
METEWSPPEQIAQSSGILASSTVVFFSDLYGRLHVLYPERPDDATPLAFSYVSWDGTSWSEPLDVLYDPQGGNLANARGVLDAQNVLHLIWGGASNTLRYASVPLEDISLVASWSVPITLVNSIGGGDIIAGSDGVLYMAYVTDLDTGAIAVIRSEDGGMSWSTPVVATISVLQSFPREVRLAVDERNRLHLVWTEVKLPDGWPPTGAYYARSMDRGETWADIPQIAGDNHGQIGVATVGEDEVHLVWRSTIGGDGTFHQWSSDGGENWSQPDRYDDRGGFSGLPSFAVDAMGNLHFAIGAGYYATWNRDGISLFEDVSTSELRSAAVRSPAERTMLTMTKGNIVHVVFENDFNSLWHTYRQLPFAPLQTAAEPVPTMPINNIQTETVAQGPDPVASLEATQPYSPDTSHGTLSSNLTSIMVGFGASALLVIVVVIAAIRGRGNR